MEKLQRALEKARAERKERSQAGAQVMDAAAPQPRRATGPRDMVGENWQRLPEFKPDSEMLKKKFIMSYDAQDEATPFDLLRTKILLIMRQNGWTRLGITSPDKACGKTTVACNLAAGFSRQSNVRSMLFDLDMRHPSVASTFGITPIHDIQKLLRQEVSAEEQMVRLRDSVAVSGAIKPLVDPAQLLLSEGLSTVFDTIEQDYRPDIMICDLSPMLVNDDARSVMHKLDCVLTIARAEQTRMAQLDICEKEVAANCNVLGTVLNDCRFVGKNDAEYGSY